MSFQDGNSLPTCWLALSYDGGESWYQIPMAGHEALEPLPEGFTTCLRPSFAYGPDGTMHYAFVAGGFGFPAHNAIYLMTSLDDGATFERPVPIDRAPPSPPDTGDLTPRMATDPSDGRLYVAWHQVTGNPATQDVLVASSGDEGETFSAPVRLNAATHNAGPPKLAVGPHGRVHVTFPATPRPPDPTRPVPPDPRPLPVQVTSSGDRGLSFGAPITAQEEFNCTLRGPNTCPPAADLGFEGRGGNGPAVAVGPSADHVYLVSYGLESRSGDDVFRVRFSVSRDGGASWSAARTLGAPPGLEGHHQITPSISTAPNGRIDIVYHDLATPSQLENTYLISSSDGGRSFGAPRLLSSVPSDTRIRPSAGFGQGPNIGSQLAASEDETAYAAWTDSRRGDPQSAKLDIFSAKVAFPTGDAPSAPADGAPVAAFAGCPPSTANVIRGTAARNSIVGTGRADRIFAAGGNDLVDGLGGDDCVDLGPGADRARGGPGADLMLGGTGADRMAGRSGGDRVRGHAGGDRISGAGGRDRMTGDGGRDVITGGSSRDRIWGGPAGDRISGGSSGDRLSGGPHADRIAGSSGNDSVRGDSGGDRLSGGTGRDRLSGGSGDDRLAARDRRRDRISCGKGRDVVLADRRDWVAGDCERVRRTARR